MKWIATAGLAAALLLAPATASGETISQEGFVKGDKSASVKLRVKVVGGVPKKVGGFRAKNVKTRCDDDRVVRIALIAETPVDVDRDGGFKVRLPDGEGGVLRISGRVKDDGRTTVGSLKTNDFQSGQLTCRVAKQRFRTSSR